MALVFSPHFISPKLTHTNRYRNQSRETSTGHWGSQTPELVMLRSVFRLVVAGVLCTIPVALLRTRALGGAGGYADFMDLGVRDFVAAAFDLLDPWRLLSWRGDLLLVAVIVAMAVLLIRSDRELRRPLLLGVAFIVIPLALFAAAGVLFPWYMYAPTAGLAMILGTLAASVPSLVGWRRLSAAMASAVAIVVLTASASWSEAPWEWRAVSDLTKLARQRLEESARTCSAEDPIYVAFLPHRVLPRAGETGLQAASGGRDYSFSAMLALEGLSKEVRAVSYLTVSGPTDQIHTRVSDSAGGFILAVEGPARIERPWNQDVVLQSDPQPGSWVEARGFRYAQREAGLEVVWDGNIGSPCVQLSILN